MSETTQNDAPELTTPTALDSNETVLGSNLTVPQSIAAAFVTTLAKRGVVLRVINNRLRHFPPSSYSQMSDSEHAILRKHRPEIIECLKSGQHHAPTLSEQQTAPPIPEKPAPAEPPPGCKYCCNRPCLGETHPAFSTLHYNDPREAERRQQLERTRYESTIRGWNAVGISRPEY
jgi:hypothetical protein